MTTATYKYYHCCAYVCMYVYIYIYIYYTYVYIYIYIHIYIYIYMYVRRRPRRQHVLLVRLEMVGLHLSGSDKILAARNLPTKINYPY